LSGRETSRCYDAANAVMSTADERAATFLTAITYLRIVLTPVVMALVMAGDRVSWATPTAAVLFAIAALTDFFDGRLARRWKQTTTMGTFLDTTADKLLVSGVLIALVAVDRASIWVAFIIIGREMLILGLRGAVSAAAGTVMRPSIWGKLKANVQFVAIFLAIWRPDMRIGDWYLDQVAMTIAAVVTLASAAEYLARFGRSLSGRPGPGSNQRSSSGS
jgi:CDP-diacylglycerol--glycerol-3-phosphate 3-phosphatidyltransferase